MDTVMNGSRMDMVEGNRWSIRRYESGMAEMWNTLVASSRNGTFLHDRRFMDYHADRFTDCSLLALRDGKPMAVLPANITPDGVLHSHQGLTYGGWLTPSRHFDGSDMIDLFGVWTDWARGEGIVEIDYKPVPFIYWGMPSGEDEYALWRFGATLSSINLSSAFEIGARPPFEKRQNRNLKKALKAGGLRIKTTEDTARFMELVNGCLEERHQATAVHTARELGQLRRNLPDRIDLWVVEDGAGEWYAGVCVFNTGRVAHSQYIATTSEGRENGSLTLLFDYLAGAYPDAKWFDFGTSNEVGGLVLNPGLIRQKTELGGRGIAYSRYTLKL